MDRHVYEDHHALDRTHWWFVGRRMIIADILAWLNLPKGGRIIDIGSGGGGMLELLLPYGTVEALEGDVPSVEEIRRRYGDRVQVMPETFERSTFAGPYQLITMFDVLEHIEDDVAALKKIYDAVAPGSLFVCTVPALPILWSGHDEMSHHFRRYRRCGLIERVRTAGFQVERVTFFNSILFLPAVLMRMVFRVTKRRDSDFRVPTSGVNALLTRIFSLERYWLRFANFPVGVSLLLVARKPAV